MSQKKESSWHWWTLAASHPLIPNVHGENEVDFGGDPHVTSQQIPLFYAGFLHFRDPKRSQPDLCGPDRTQGFVPLHQLPEAWRGVSCPRSSHVSSKIQVSMCLTSEFEQIVMWFSTSGLTIMISMSCGLANDSLCLWLYSFEETV